MKKFGKILLIGLGFSLVAIALSFLTSKPAPAQHPPHVEPVKVTNTPLPVQVTNTVPVSGAVTATIANTPVPVSGTVNANFSNTSSTPLFADTDGPARSGVAASCDVQFTVPPSQVSCVIANVPSGKILVIETISCGANVPTGADAPGIALLVGSTSFSGGLINVYYRLAMPKVGTVNISDGYGITTPVRIYTSPGGFVTLIATGESSSSLRAEASCAISGHLVNP